MSFSRASPWPTCWQKVKNKKTGGYFLLFLFFGKMDVGDDGAVMHSGTDAVPYGEGRYCGLKRPPLTRGLSAEQADWGRELPGSLPPSALRAATSLIRGRLWGADFRSSTQAVPYGVILRRSQDRRRISPLRQEILRCAQDDMCFFGGGDLCVAPVYIPTHLGGFEAVVGQGVGTLQGVAQPQMQQHLQSQAQNVEDEIGRILRKRQPETQ